MFTSRYLFQAIIAMMIMAAWTSAQESDVRAADPSAEQAERLAEELQDRAAAWAEAQEARWEHWAEQQSKSWEKWAKKYEQQWEDWAAEHERAWEAWAKDYEANWEEWSKDLESGEFDAHELKDMFRQNMEMLGEMPLEQMYMGILKNTARLEEAPWEQLADLEGLVGESIESALQELESQYQLRDRDDDAGDANLQALRESLKKVQEALEATRADVGRAADKHVEQLRAQLRQLESIDDDQERQEAVEKAMRAYHKAVRNAELGRGARERAELLVREQVERERQRAERMTRDALRDEARGMRDRLLEVVERDRARIESKNAEIRELRREVQQLRRDLERLKGEHPEDQNDGVI